MIMVDCEQMSPEWFQYRCGVPSASNFDKIVTSKGSPSRQATNYMYKLASERIVGTKEETYQSDAMTRGIELESEAKDLFRMLNDIEVKEVGLCYKDDDRQFSCSPDGIINDSEGLEIKCPLSHTHVKYLLDNKLPIDYIQQVQGSMLVTGFQSWWFMSYFPGMPPLIVEVKRDNDFCAKLKVELDEFCTKLDEITEQLRGME